MGGVGKGWDEEEEGGRDIKRWKGGILIEIILDTIKIFTFKTFQNFHSTCVRGFCEYF